MALKPCRECATEVSSKAKTCPKCGIKNPVGMAKGTKKAIAIGSIIIFVGAVIHGMIGGLSSATATQAQPEPPEVVNAISVDDFMVDAAKYADKTVSIRGSAMCVNATLCAIYTDGNTTLQGFYFDPSNLSRDDRRMLLDCNIYTNKCSVVLVAKGVDNSSILQQIAPSRIDWLQKPSSPASQ